MVLSGDAQRAEWKRFHDAVVNADKGALLKIVSSIRLTQKREDRQKDRVWSAEIDSVDILGHFANYFMHEAKAYGVDMNNQKGMDQFCCDLRVEAYRAIGRLITGTEDINEDDRTYSFLARLKEPLVLRLPAQGWAA